MKTTAAPTITMSIYIAGDINQARQVCREWCMARGACFTVEAVEFIYTGGSETGVRIGLINYPRFPSSITEMRAKAEGLALCLIDRLCQQSCSIEMPDETLWLSRRPEAAQ